MNEQNRSMRPFRMGVGGSAVVLALLLLAGMVLVLTSPGYLAASVSVTVISDDGVDVNGTVVSLYMNDTLQGQEVADPAGAVTFTGVDPGDHEVLALLELDNGTTLAGRGTLVVKNATGSYVLTVKLEATDGTDMNWTGNATGCGVVGDGSDSAASPNDGGGEYDAGEHEGTEPRDDSDGVNKGNPAVENILPFPYLMLLGGGAAFLMVLLIASLVIFALYSKIRADRLMDHDTRRKIYRYIEENPGEHLRSIKKGLSLPMGVLTHHLTRLETEEMVKVRQSGQYKRYWTYNVPVDGNPYLSATQKQVVDAIRKHPGATPVELVGETGMTRHNIYYHTGKLEGLGVITLKRDDEGTKRYFVMQDT